MRDHPSDGEQLRATRRRPRRMGGRAPACSARASQTRSCTWIRLGHQGHWSTSSVTEAAMPSFSTLRSPSSASATYGVVDTLSKYQRRPRVLSGAGGGTSTTSPRSRSCGYRPTQARLKALCTTAGSAARDPGPSMPARTLTRRLKWACFVKVAREAGVAGGPDPLSPQHLGWIATLTNTALGRRFGKVARRAGADLSCISTFLLSRCSEL